MFDGKKTHLLFELRDLLGQKSPAVFTQRKKSSSISLDDVDVAIDTHYKHDALTLHLLVLLSLLSLSLINTTTHFFSFFCAAFFFTICNRFMALNWDSWDVCPLSPAAAAAAAFEPLPPFPFPPPLLPPFPPALTWELLGELDPFPWFSPLDGRFSDCFPRVRGGGGFSDA